MTEPDADVVVVGAGIAGLACALHLHRAGRRVIVLEAADEVGGRMRTDIVDGWRLDRGFQVHDTAYAEVARLLEGTGGQAGLDLRPFTTGALVHVGDSFARVADPRRHPGSLPATLVAPIGGVRDKAATGLLGLRLLATPARRLLDEPETSAREWLRRRGISQRMVEVFWRPYLSGVLGEDELRTSSRFLTQVLRSQARGHQVLPAQGIGAIPRQLAAGLAPGTVRLDAEAVEVRRGQVRCATGAVVRSRCVVLAADPATAHRLLPALGPAPRLNPLTTHWLAAPDLDPEPVIRLEGGGRAAGPLANTAVLPSTQAGRLLGATVLGAEGRLEEVRAQLHRWHGPVADGWPHLASHTGWTVDASPPQGRLRRPVQVAAGVFVAGDSRDSPSTQGAAVSGRRAATAVLAELT